MQSKENYLTLGECFGEKFKVKVYLNFFADISTLKFKYRHGF